MQNLTIGEPLCIFVKHLHWTLNFFFKAAFLRELYDSAHFTDGGKAQGRFSDWVRASQWSRGSRQQVRARGRRGKVKPGPSRYLGAAVQRGLAEGAAAQDADGDVVQLLLLGRAAAAPRSRAGAGPRARVPATPGLAPEVRVEGVAVSLVLAQHRHGGGGSSLRVPQQHCVWPRSPQTPGRGSVNLSTAPGSMVASAPLLCPEAVLGVSGAPDGLSPPSSVHFFF